MKKITIGIAGNPNCGKTTLFNSLTGTRQKVGNWPGVTVEKKTGEYTHKNIKVEVVDLPGIYSMSASSIDETVARDYIIKEHPDLIVNIIDASHLERNLYLTVQLIEMRIPVIIAMNMMDIIEQERIIIDLVNLSKTLDCPVIKTVANKNIGTDNLKDIINDIAKSKKKYDLKITYPAEVTKSIETISSFLKKNLETVLYNPEWLALKLLESENILTEKVTGLDNIVNNCTSEIERIYGESADIVIADSRYGFINFICNKLIDRSNLVKKNISNTIDNIVLNRIFGIPIFLLAMYLTFWLTINLGNCFIDFFDILFGSILVDGFGHFLSSIGVPAIIKILLADGLGLGIQTVSTFIPPIFMIFFCLSILEDSGYMARAAFIMDRFMRFIGLPGKAFVPMLVGFGCNVPAILATRTLNNRKDRILTILLNPLMSCGARLPVYTFFAAVFFPRTGDIMIFSLYLTGITTAIFLGLLFKNTILKGDYSAFIMELPPYHIPTIRGVLIHTWFRLKGFMIRAGKAILTVIIILSLLNSIGTDFKLKTDTKNTILGSIGKLIVPIFKPMGITQDNWPATVGIFTGIFAKETIVGTLDSLYTYTDNTTAQEPEEFILTERIKEAFISIPSNLSDLTPPFSFSGFSNEDSEPKSNVTSKNTIYRVMYKKFDGRVGAFAYLLFVLLYIPCAAAMATIFKELNLGWTIFAISYLTCIAWMISTLFYQLARFTQHPLSSTGWIIFVVSFFIIFYIILKKISVTYFKNNK